MVNSQLLPTVKPQVRAHMPTAANEPQPCTTDFASTSESRTHDMGVGRVREFPYVAGVFSVLGRVSILRT